MKTKSMVWMMLFAVLSLTVWADEPPLYKEFDASDVQRLSIHNGSGQTYVTGGKSTKIKITAVRIRGKCNLEIEKDAGVVRIEVERRRGRSWDNCRHNISIEAPSQIGFTDVHVGSGNVLIKHLDSTFDLKVGSGDSHLDGLGGQLHAATGSGNLTGNLMANRVKLKTGSGDVDLKLNDLVANLDMKSGSGDINLLLAKGAKDVRIKTASGDIDLTFAAITADGDADVKLVSGDVTVKLPKDVSVNVLGKKRYTFRDAENKKFDFRVRSISGDVRVINP